MCGMNHRKKMTMIPSDDTEYLLSTTNNTAKLEESIEQLKSGNIITMEIEGEED